MLKLAFASCMHPLKKEPQDVWDHILREQPQYLILLGDFVYYDHVGMDRIVRMTDNDFAVHAHALLTRQLQVPAFRKLLETPGLTTLATWDDHDFLWNNAGGMDYARSPAHEGKVHISTALFKLLQGALRTGNLAQFPVDTLDARIWASSRGIDSPSVRLTDRVWLHVPDGRSWRATRPGRRQLLGAEQRDRFAQLMTDHPDEVHLLASGSTLDAGNEHWTQFPDDLAWLMRLAKDHRCLLLSGDIHDTAFREHATGGYPLFEATSSGAAIRWLISLGPNLCNHGLLTIDETSIEVCLNALGNKPVIHAINLQSWSVL